MPAHYWTELPSNAFQDDALRDHVAVLPLGATEQHGPHLPVSTDSSIADGLMDAVVAKLPQETNVLILPTLAITHSGEHTNRPGTLSLGRDLTFRLIMDIARGVARAGVRKLVIINAHGGNVAVMVDATHDIRAELGMLCVATNWMRLGLPDGLITPDDKALDIHGGRLETAIMLALRPDLVDQGEARDFPSLQADLADRFDLLRAYGPVRFGWMGDDLNASGAVGKASKASAADGKAIIDHQAQQMVRLLDEVQRFQPAWFAQTKK
ncbi:MAG: creatininase family protein [Hyphomicrobiales bacterium]